MGQVVRELGLVCREGRTKSRSPSAPSVSNSITELWSGTSKNRSGQGEKNYVLWSGRTGKWVCFLQY